MKNRLLGAGLAATTLVASTLVLAGPATADPSFTPDAAAPNGNDVVGVGSDTTELVVDELASAYNATLTGSDPAKVASWDATKAGEAAGTWVSRTGAAAANRPNGSGQGKARLYGSANDTNVNFARSSSALSTTEADTGRLSAYPFAVDGLKLAVSKQVATHAPASLSRADLLKIYNGTYKQWKDIPGYAGTAPDAYIKPYTPQSGSGTRSFFEAQLAAERGGGTAWQANEYGASSGSYAGVKDTMQEHDPTLIQNDPDAIAPFSTARAFKPASNQSAVQLVGGWEAKRAVYNVVRDDDRTSAWVDAVFDDNGFICSAAGRQIILDNGFAPLATTAQGGACGVVTKTPTTNFTTSTQATTTSLAASSAGRAVTLVATVAAGGQSADGTVEFLEGGTKVGEALVSGGKASRTLQNVAVGSHSYTARYVPANANAFSPSETTQATSVQVKRASMVTVSAPGRTPYGSPRSITVAVSDDAGSARSGNVTVTFAGATYTAVLSNGQASVGLPATAPAGDSVATASWAGDADTAAGAGSAVVGIDRAPVTVSQSFPTKVKKRKRAVGVVTVAIPGSGVAPSGGFTITQGRKVLVSSSLTGSSTVTLPKLKKGKRVLTLTYGGSSNTSPASLTFVVKQK